MIDDKKQEVIHFKAFLEVIPSNMTILEAMDKGTAKVCVGLARFRDRLDYSLGDFLWIMKMPSYKFVDPTDLSA